MRGMARSAGRFPFGRPLLLVRVAMERPLCFAPPHASDSPSQMLVLVGTLAETLEKPA